MRRGDRPVVPTLAQAPIRLNADGERRDVAAPQGYAAKIAPELRPGRAVLHKERKAYRLGRSRQAIHTPRHANSTPPTEQAVSATSINV